MLLYLYSLLCFMVPGTAWLFINRKELSKCDNRIRHIIWSYIFMLYCYTAVQDAAGIGTLWDLIYYGGLNKSINLIPFKADSDRIYMLNILNILMFMPLGFLLPLIWKKYRKIIKVVFVGFFMSLSIEVCQLFCNRATDIDDIIMNTLGTIVGYICWIMFKRIFAGAGEKAIEVSKAEAMIYLFGGIIGIVLLYNCRIFC